MVAPGDKEIAASKGVKRRRGAQQALPEGALNMSAPNAANTVPWC
jgi:hypothetical protein